MSFVRSHVRPDAVRGVVSTPDYYLAKADFFTLV